MPPGRPKTGKKLRIFPVFAAFAMVSRKCGLWLIAHEKADMPATDISAKITKRPRFYIPTLALSKSGYGSGKHIPLSAD